MPPIKVEQWPDPEVELLAYLRSFGSVEKYITSVHELVPAMSDSNVNGVAHQAHQALLQQLQHLVPRFVRGTQLMTAMESTRLMPVGVDSVDELLLGGLKETAVTELSGETCSGKTQLCHMAAVTTAKRGEAVVYLDTTNAFSGARLQQLMDVSKFDNSVADAVALDRVIVIPCHDVYGLLTSLDGLALQATKLESDARPKLVVVDSVSALLAPVIGATQHHQGNALVSEIGRLLRQVAEALHAAVLVTNHVVGTSIFGRSPGPAVGGGGLHLVNTDYKPALGEQWRGVSHVRLQLSRATAAADTVCMTILAHPLRAPGEQAWIRVAQRLEDTQPIK